MQKQRASNCNNNGKHRVWLFKTKEFAMPGLGEGKLTLDTLNALCAPQDPPPMDLAAIVWQQVQTTGPGSQFFCTGYIRFKKQPRLSTIHESMPHSQAFSQAWLTWTPADQHANWPQVKCKNNLTAHIVAEALLGGAQHRIGHLKANGLPHSAAGVPTQGTRAQLKEARDLEIKNFIEGGATLDDVRENYYSDYKAATSHWKAECERQREKEALQKLCRVTFEDLVTWQKELVTMCSNAECGADPEMKGYPRKIYWYADEAGGRGKSEVMRHLQAHFSAYQTGDTAQYRDIIHGYEPDKHSRVVIFHYTRACSTPAHYCYEAMEAFLEGTAFSSKYNSKTRYFGGPCHVIVFANGFPDESRFTWDRWAIKNLAHEPSLVGTPPVAPASGTVGNGGQDANADCGTNGPTIGQPKPGASKKDVDATFDSRACNPVTPSVPPKYVPKPVQPQPQGLHP